VRAVVILHVPDSPYGAVRMGYGRLARAMEDRGGSLDILTPERFRVTARLHARWWVLVLPFAAAWWLWRRRRDYDVALFHSYAGWVFHLLPSRLPTMTEFHGVEPLFHAALEAEHRARGRRLSPRYRLVYGWLMPRLLRWSCRRSRMVTCLNRAERAYLVDHGWAPSDRVAMIRQGVPREFFIERREYAPRATRLLVLSQWLETKGVGYLADAFVDLARRHPDLELWCYGTRVDGDVVRNRFPPELRARVTAVEHIPLKALPAVFQRADIFVHPSLSEAWGNAILQAMASALPIAVTPVGLVPELLEDERDCLLVPTCDAPALAAAIARLIDDVELRRRLGEGARRAAEGVEAEAPERQHVALVEAVAAVA
jgi:glycosyltransferase involved in cell wall biosynthesis